MAKKIKEFDYVKNAARLRREEEIALHGKQISLRKGGVHSSKKDYKRDKKVSLDD